MINYMLLIPALASFCIVLALSPFWIRKAKEIGLLWDDMNKFQAEKVSGSGGVIVVLGFILGTLVYVSYRVFFLESHNGSLVEIFSLLTVTLLLASVGFMDDLFGWRKGGLSRRSRIILAGMASIPLIAINAGKSSIAIPFLGSFDVGLLYPLIFIPLGIVGATTTFNFLAGFNGLEAGNGIIILLALAIVSFLTGNSWLSVIAFCMCASLLAFLRFNFSPAKVFPGDALTYCVGGLIAIMAILGNYEKIAVFFFIPYILEFLLKSRGGLKKHSFGKPMKDGSLDLNYEKIYSLNHLSIYLMKIFNIKATEIKVVFSIWAFQIIVILLGFLIFSEGISG